MTANKTKLVGTSVVLIGAALLAISFGMSAEAVGPKTAPDAKPHLSVFTGGAPVIHDERLASIATAIANVDPADLSKARKLQSKVGKYESDLIAFPSQRGGNICYALIPKRLEDPGASYCYQPRTPDAPAALAGQHFHAMAFMVNHNGLVTQLFGIAFDDVKSMRVNVAGEWRDVPLSRNGFYLELPNVAHEDVGIVEATLANGETQVHDIQKGG